MGKEACSLATLEPVNDEYVKSVGIIETAKSLETIADRIHTLNKSQVALVIIHLDYLVEGRVGHNYQEQINQGIYHYLTHLRSLVRRTDSVFLQDHTAYFILPGANLQGGQIVLERLWDALLWRINNTLEGSSLHPDTISIGCDACSAPFIDVYQCIDAASEPRQSFTLQTQRFVRKTDTANEMELPERARQLGVPYVSFLPRKLPVRLKRLVAPTLAQELGCFPIGRDRDILTVAMTDPQDRCVLERLHRETGLRIFPVLAHPREIQMVLEQFS